MKDMIENLPVKIQSLVSDKEYTCDDMGKSQTKVLMFDDCVLKIEKTSEKNDEFVKMMRWLEGKLPVPKVIAYEKDEAAGLQYLLMSRLTGKMSCDDYYMSRPKELCEQLAQALKLLWSVDISDCPRKITLDDLMKF